MFCPNCGTKMEDGARYCSNCGYGNNQKNKEILETTNINNEVLKTEKINNNAISSKEPSIQNTPNNIEISNEHLVIEKTTVTNEINKNEVNVETLLNNKETPNNSENLNINEIRQSVGNNTIHTNPNNDNKTAIIVMLSIIIFIILFLVAIYLAFFSEDSKLEKTKDNEVEIKEEKEKSKQDYSDDSIEATIETDEETITFLVPEVCTNNYIQDSGDNYKYYSGNDLECLNISFLYWNYESAEEGREMIYTDPTMTEYDMEKMTVELNNGIKAPALKITEHLGVIFYPVSNNSYIEIRVTLNEFTEPEIRKYIIVKE